MLPPWSAVDRNQLRKDGITLFSRLIRTKNVENYQDKSVTVPRAHDRKHKLMKCLSTLDLTSLGVGSCVGTGMYLVAGMVARNVAGPGVIISFMIAALASIFSGVCYAEFGVRVPNTTGSAYVYSYVTVGEFIAFVIGWNMILEYLIGTSACACALSACFDAMTNSAISQSIGKSVGTFFGRPPDFLAFLITVLMTILTAAGAKKSLIFSNILNIINLVVWVFIMTASLFYIDTRNWTEHSGFLPYGWSGVLTGAATCFYAFIGFDIIATTGEEAKEPKKSIPLAIISSLAIILIAYVTSSIVITLIIPYDQVDQDSALVEMFGQVGAQKCKFVVAIGALAGLTVSMFGSMFPMPRVIYAMAQDGLIFRSLSQIIPKTGTPVIATVVSGLTAAIAALLIKLEVLVEMMSIGTLLAYTLVSTCVLILRYQPHSTNLVELLPQSLRTPLVGSPTNEMKNGQAHQLFGAQIKPHELTQALESTRISNTVIPAMNANTVTIRKVMRNSPDSDDTIEDEESEDDQFLVADRTANQFYGTVQGTPNNANCGGVAGLSNTSNSSFIDRKLESFAYLCPAFFPWIERGPATKESGMFVMKMVGILYLLIILFDLIVVCSMHTMNGAVFSLLLLVILAMLLILLLISRKPQNRSSLLFTTPGLPFVPAIAITVNIYLILKLSILTLIRFIFWMTLGMIMYFKYGIKNSQLEHRKETNNIELTISDSDKRMQFEHQVPHMKNNRLNIGSTGDQTGSKQARPPSPNIIDSINSVWESPQLYAQSSNVTNPPVVNTENTRRRTAAENRAIMANSRQTESGSLFIDESEFPNWDD